MMSEQALRTQPFGATGVTLPVIGQGTWLMESGRQAAVRALRAGLDLGLNHIDTAEMYGSGKVEELVGEAIAGRRDEVFLVSKVLPSNASFQGTLAACERSLTRLGTDRLDCYLLHWPGSYPLAETFRAFAQLREQGKILSCGVSNFDVDDMTAALALVDASAIACNQVLYHLEERHIESELLDWCRSRQIAVVAYSPLGGGEFPAADSAGGQVLATIAARHGATVQQVALAFLTRQDGVFAIPKASHEQHVRHNAAAGQLHLSGDELAAIEQAFPLQQRPALPMR